MNGAWCQKPGLPYRHNAMSIGAKLESQPSCGGAVPLPVWTISASCSMKWSNCRFIVAEADMRRKPGLTRWAGGVVVVHEGMYRETLPRQEQG